MLDKLGDKALAYLNAFEELAKQYTPTIIDAALKVVQINGLQTLIIGFSLVLLFIIYFVFAILTAKKMKKANPHIDMEGYTLLALIVGTVPFALGATGAQKVLNIWNWVAIFEPKLYIAYRIFEKML